MSKVVYDCTKLAEKLDGWSTLDFVKSTMLEAIGNLSVAFTDKDANRMLELQCDLMWVFEVLNTIKEVKQ